MVLYAYMCVFAHSHFVKNPLIWSWETNPSFLRWFCHTNPSVLSWHRQGLPRNSNSTLPTLPFRGFHWSPNGPAQSQIIHTTFTNWSGEGTSPKSHEREPPLDFYHNLPSKHIITNGKPPQDGVTRINWKDNLNVSTVPSNSYKLMLKHMVL
jgi:hypothetical protein